MSQSDTRVGTFRVLAGEVPYRDFYFHNTPLAFYLYAIPFLFSDDNPANVILLRNVSFFAGIVTLLCVWCATSRSRWGVLGAIILLLGKPFIQTGAEIRRDNPAIAFLLLAVVIAGENRIRPGIRGALIGSLYCLTVLTNEKALTYAAPLLAVFLVTFFRRELPARQFIGSPAAFLAALISIGAGAILLLAAAGAIPAWFEWNVIFTLMHEKVYPGFNWQDTFLKFLFESWWVFSLAGFGVAETTRRARRQPIPADELLLLLLLPATLLSYEMLAAPYIYSLLPFQVILAVFAGRGLISVCSYLKNRSNQKVEIASLALLGILFLPPFFIHISSES